MKSGRNHSRSLSPFQTTEEKYKPVVIKSYLPHKRFVHHSLSDAVELAEFR